MRAANRLLKFRLGCEMHYPSIFWLCEVLFEGAGLLDEARDLIAEFDYRALIARLFCFKNVDKVFSSIWTGRTRSSSKLW